jgi:uncharacterized protein (DUF2344 family)
MAMKKPKPKLNEPSARDKLSASFVKALQNDFETYGVETIEKLRQENAKAYVEIAAKVISTIEPKAEEAKDTRSIAIGLLKDTGMSEFEMSEEDITDAAKAREILINELLAIRDRAQGLIQ